MFQKNDYYAFTDCDVRQCNISLNVLQYVDVVYYY